MHRHQPFGDGYVGAPGSCKIVPFLKVHGFRDLHHDWYQSVQISPNMAYISKISRIGNSSHLFSESNHYRVWRSQGRIDDYSVDAIHAWWREGKQPTPKITHLVNYCGVCYTPGLGYSRTVVTDEFIPGLGSNSINQVRRTAVHHNLPNGREVSYSWRHNSPDIRVWKCSL